ncbi:MAG: bifunctional adenosylcobinamide kinase/adenosylcobinamide-phosphate guanylyltransferase [Synergistaceae bacterium]|nr:bifunctional adenosylcobinamide kinase/adenosylcobinamide-phosphate guanylyltransferase [Synergistaceae bacterium]
MFVFVSGPARGGKSAWAEEFTLSLARQGKTPLVYLATAHVTDAEMRERVSRHQAARAGKGFTTLERETSVAEAAPFLPFGSTVLLECLGTLLANEMFGEEGGACKLAEKIHADLTSLRGQAANLLVVSNDVFSDGNACGEVTENYRRTLGALHVILAREADLAVECVFVPQVYPNRRTTSRFT